MDKFYIVQFILLFTNLENPTEIKTVFKSVLGQDRQQHTGSQSAVKHKQGWTLLKRKNSNEQTYSDL